MSLLSVAGLDLNKVVSDGLVQAQSAGIQLEDHLITQLTPVLSRVIADALTSIQQAEQPLLTEVDKLREVVANLVPQLSVLLDRLDGATVTITLAAKKSGTT